MSEFLDYSGLQTYHDKLIDYINGSDSAALKSVEYANGKLNFYTNDSTTAPVAFEVDLPQEQFLDQASTQFVPSFEWSSTLYPGSTNPNYDGKPVLVLGVKTKGDSSDTITYSFINLNDLVDTYTGGNTQTATISVSNAGVITSNVKISAVSGNVLVSKSDGLFVPASASPEGKADKVEDATAGNFAGLDSDGNLTDSGKKAGDFIEKIANPTNGNLVKMDSNGGLVDLGKGISDIALMTYVGSLPTETEATTIIGYVDEQVAEAEPSAITEEQINALFD